MDIYLSTSRSDARIARLAAPLLAVGVLLALLAFAPSAAAQSICDQYPNLPICQGDGGPGGGDGDADEGPGSGGGEDDAGPTADLGGGAGGELPFTGYPLTPLLLLL